MDSSDSKLANLSPGFIHSSKAICLKCLKIISPFSIFPKWHFIALQKIVKNTHQPVNSYILSDECFCGDVFGECIS